MAKTKPTLNYLTNKIIKAQQDIKSLAYFYQKKQENEVQKYSLALSYKLQKKQASKEKKLQDKLHKLEMNLKRLNDNKKLVVYKVKDKSDFKKKKRALAEFQKYCKLIRCNSKGYLKVVDTGERRHYKGCDGGHYRPQHNYPQLAFNVNNCRPITKKCNEMQGDNIGTRREKQFIESVGSDTYTELKEIADDKSLKNQLRDGTYYDMQYRKYKELNQELLKNL